MNDGPMIQCPGCLASFRTQDAFAAHRRGYHGWQPHPKIPEAAAPPTHADLSMRIGEQNTTIGYQDAMLALLRAASTDLLNQLTLLTRDDMAYLWKIGGRPLDDAFLALKRAVDATKASE